MNITELEFIKYTPISNEKHLGIALVRYLSRIYLRYKVMPSKDGNGYWFSCGSAKVGVKHDGTDNYEEWFQIDSSYEKDKIKNFLQQHVTPLIANSQSSIFQGGQALPGQIAPGYSNNRIPSQNPYAESQIANQIQYQQQSIPDYGHSNAVSDPWSKPPF